MLSLCIITALAIPSLEIKTGVVRASPVLWEQRNWTEFEKDNQRLMKRTAIMYPHHPVIAGHSSPPLDYTGRAGWLFANLHKAKEGDTISARRCTKNVEYVVTKTWIEDEKNVANVLLKIPEGSIRIFTCFPVGRKLMRFVVEAKEVDI